MTNEEARAFIEEAEKAIEASSPEAWFEERRHREIMASLLRGARPRLITVGIDAPEVFAFFDEMADALPDMDSLTDWETWVKARRQREAESEQHSTN